MEAKLVRQIGVIEPLDEKVERVLLPHLCEEGGKGDRRVHWRSEMGVCRGGLECAVGHSQRAVCSRNGRLHGQVGRAVVLWCAAEGGRGGRSERGGRGRLISECLNAREREGSGGSWCAGRPGWAFMAD